MPRLNCLTCGCEFTVPPCREHKAKYCSKACADKARQNRAMFTCAYCGKEFEQRKGRHPLSKRHFCSPKCYYLNGGKGKQGNYFICANCGKRFYRPKADSRKDTKCCSVVCSSICRRDPNGNVKKNIRQCGKSLEWKKAIFKRDGYYCQDCGKWGGRLVAHHNTISFIDLWNQMLAEFGGKDLYEFAINYQPLWETDNGITLCTDCHWLRHSLVRVETERQAPSNGMKLQSDTPSNRGAYNLIS